MTTTWLDRIRGLLRLDFHEQAVIAEAIVHSGLSYDVFLGEANHVGYTPAGAHSPLNDLYRQDISHMLAAGCVLASIVLHYPCGPLPVTGHTNGHGPIEPRDSHRPSRGFAFRPPARD